MGRSKTREPLELIHFEELPDKSSAYKLEIKIKKLTKAEKERYIRASASYESFTSP